MLLVYPVLALAITEVAASMASMVTALAMQVIMAVVSIQLAAMVPALAPPMDPLAPHMVPLAPLTVSAPALVLAQALALALAQVPALVPALAPALVQALVPALVPALVLALVVWEATSAFTDPRSVTVSQLVVHSEASQALDSALAALAVALVVLDPPNQLYEALQGLVQAAPAPPLLPLANNYWTSQNLAIL